MIYPTLASNELDYPTAHPAFPATSQEHDLDFSTLEGT